MGYFTVEKLKKLCMQEEFKPSREMKKLLEELIVFSEERKLPQEFSTSALFEDERKREIRNFFNRRIIHATYSSSLSFEFDSNNKVTNATEIYEDSTKERALREAAALLLFVQEII